MSTQQPVRRAAFAAPNAVTLALAFCIWLVSVILIGLLAYVFGADAATLGGAVALALAPALAGLILLPMLNGAFATFALIATWLLAATGLVAGGGGAFSPMVALFAIAPALTFVAQRAWAAEVGAAAVLAYACAAALALLAREPAALLGPFPEMIAVLALAFGAGLIASAPRAAPVTPSPILSQRIAEVSHELRTPLTHILGFAELIEQQIAGPIDARYVEYASLIRRAGGQLLELVNDQLDASRIEAGRYELEVDVFDVRAVMNDVAQLSRETAERKQIALSAWAPETPLMVRADGNAVRRMLINTIGNAIKFTPTGGRVIIAARADGRSLVLETIDNGPGIPNDERALLGQAYERGKGGATATGTGLGLSLVRALAELHGGRLSFHDAPGGGALVRIEMPVLAAQP